MRKGSDLYIAILEYGKDHLEGFRRFEAAQYPQNIGFQTTESNIVLNNVLDANFEVIAGSHDRGSMLFVLKSEGYFGLLNYYQLMESRKANKYARIGIILALALSIVSDTISNPNKLGQILTVICTYVNVFYSPPRCRKSSS